MSRRSFLKGAAAAAAYGAAGGALTSAISPDHALALIQSTTWQNNRKIALRAAANGTPGAGYRDGYFVSVSTGTPDSPLIANRSNVGTWERFTLEGLSHPGNPSAPGSYFSLRSEQTGGLVCAQFHSGEPGWLVANRSAIGQWEKFDLYPGAYGDSHALLAHANSKFVCAESAGGAPLIANRSAIGPWETFWIYDLQRFINMHQVLRAFPNRHPGMAKAFTTNYPSVEDPRRINTDFLYERHVSLVDGAPSGDVCAVMLLSHDPALGNYRKFTVFDHYQLTPSSTGLHCTVPTENRPITRSQHSPQIVYAPTAFAMENWGLVSSSVNTHASSVNLAGGGPGNAGPWSSIVQNEPQHRQILGFGVQDFGGTVGSRWFVRIGHPPWDSADPKESWYYDLGPQLNVFEPEYGTLGYRQEYNDGFVSYKYFGALVTAASIPESGWYAVGQKVVCGTAAMGLPTHDFNLG